MLAKFVVTKPQLSVQFATTYLCHYVAIGVERFGTNTVAAAVVDAGIAVVASVPLAHNSSVATAFQNNLQHSSVLAEVDVVEDAPLVVA